jgi:hypothetical protein
MGETLPVRCPACRRDHVFTAQAYPCACGAPAVLHPDPSGAPAPLAHHTWAEAWVTVRCAACGRANQWPQPELGCPCGTVLRVPVAGSAPATTGRGTRSAPPAAERPRARSRRAAFRPVTIRTARDAVTAAALYLRWLGYGDIRRADQRPPSGIGLVAHGLVAQVDPTVRPASVRDVECLWLTAMTESAACAYFTLAGYTEDARTRADTLGVPLFVLDLTGTPQPVNPPADTLNTTGT